MCLWGTPSSLVPESLLWNTSYSPVLHWKSSIRRRDVRFELMYKDLILPCFSETFVQMEANIGVRLVLRRHSYTAEYGIGRAHNNRNRPHRRVLAVADLEPRYSAVDSSGRHDTDVHFSDLQVALLEPPLRARRQRRQAGDTVMKTNTSTTASPGDTSPPLSSANASSSTPSSTGGATGSTAAASPSSSSVTTPSTTSTTTDPFKNFTLEEVSTRVSFVKQGCMKQGCFTQGQFEHWKVKQGWLDQVSLNGWLEQGWSERVVGLG